MFVKIVTHPQMSFNTIKNLQKMCSYSLFVLFSDDLYILQCSCNSLRRKSNENIHKPIDKASNSHT